MTPKRARIASLTEGLHDPILDSRYLGYFECFNKQLFFEAHEVLEGLWLECRDHPDGLFYKGLIQFAGAFVHLQKNRPGPALALFKLARRNLQHYPVIHHRLDLREVLDQEALYVRNLERGSAAVIHNGRFPALYLLGDKGESSVDDPRPRLNS